MRMPPDGHRGHSSVAEEEIWDREKRRGADLSADVKLGTKLTTGLDGDRRRLPSDSGTNYAKSYGDWRHEDLLPTMDGLDGILLIPPERGQILGRAVWKPRYVVINRPLVSSRDNQPSVTFSNTGTPGRTVSSASRPPIRVPHDEYMLSMFKSKEDTEPACQWPVNSITDCTVQMLSHRKQGHVLPTLVLTIADKDRKRRSSRAAGLISKDAASTTIWFRTPPDNNYPSLHDWARCILSKKGIMSPDSPVSPMFPGPTARRDAPETIPRPGSGNTGSRYDSRQLAHKASIATHSTSTRERPLTFSSESPSLKSKRSDLSSPSSSTYPIQHFGYPTSQNYPNAMPYDLPSPTTTADYQGDFIEGWTSAQGRSSTVSSPAHGRDSISSQAVPASIADPSSPSAPRETILDRAFQMHFIPGSEREVPGEEKLSSLARFEALMREADAKRKQREPVETVHKIPMRSAFDADDSSDEGQEPYDSDSDNDSFVHEQDALRSPSLIPPSAQRALDFITNRHDALQSPTSPRPSYARNHLSFHAGAAHQRLPVPPARPHTAHGKSRVNQDQQSNSTSQQPSSIVPSDGQGASARGLENSSRPQQIDRRQSKSSSKRSSFTEFTKRLSSTSSLLLVQTNVSGGSSRPSSEVDTGASMGRTGLNPRGMGLPARERDRDDPEKRCGWRSSVGVVGSEGGFL
ncbi:hypothetical protein HJFPF1_06675 [Paramyrothecium foliicola]|nr:hypothetical protein HJFPF1_06675 [Paramyrothecium foliicola]